jgi:hypothetical protein
LWKEQIIEVTDENNRNRSYLLMPNYDVGYDSLYLNWGNVEDYLGTYYTTSIVGTPGGDYRLDITQNGKTYTAIDRMPIAASIDSVVLRNDGKGIDGKGEDGFYVPYLYFKKPEGRENYFLFTYKLYEWYPMMKLPIPKSEKFESLLFQSIQWSSTWNYSVLSDRYMAEYISGYKIIGASSETLINGTDYEWGGRLGYWTFADFYIVSVSSEACLFFQALTEQFYQDGGAFSPAPASPPTNLSNGAQGFFMAAAVVQKRYDRSDQ